MDLYVKNSVSTLRSAAVGGSHLFDLAYYTMFGASVECFIHVYRPSAVWDESAIQPQDASLYRLRKCEMVVTGGATKDGHFS